MNIFIDKNAKTTPTNFSWQFGVGNDHAFQMHRTDMCEHIRLAHEELGFRYLRFHGIFDDDMLCVQRLSDYKPFRAVPHSKEIEEVNFLQVAKVYDNVLSCGMKPFVELSFMPSALASGKKTGIRYLNNITQPKSLARWCEFVTAFVKFLLRRYGKEEVESWYFEVWNEPDLAIFFKGKQQDYFRLYEATARAVKKVDENLRVGGPSSSACLWLKDFKAFCEKNAVPCDFLSTHHYPGDAFGNTFSMKDAFRMMRIAKYAAKDKIGLSAAMQDLFFRPEVYKTWRKGVLSELDERAKQQAGGKALFMTEWNSMAVFASPVHDEKFSAAFIVKTVLDSAFLMDGYIFWCCSDIYEEQFMLGTPFHGGFGLINNVGIPKPNFWAFKLLSKLYPQRIVLPKQQGDVEYAAFTDGKNVQVLLYVQDMDYFKRDTHEVTLSLNVPVRRVTAQRIDDTHCNPKAEWQKLGSPDLLTREEVAAIKQRTRLCAEEVPFSSDGGKSIVQAVLSANDVVLFTFEA